MPVRQLPALERVAPTTDPCVERTATAVVFAMRDGVLDTAIDVGRVIIEGLYGGDLRAWRSRGPKAASFRRLATHEALVAANISAAVLSRCCGIYEVDQRLGVSARKHLTATHVRAVLGLPDDQQRALLQEAEAQDLTSRELARIAAKVRKKAGERRGRPPLPAFVKGIRRLERLDADDVFGELDAVASLPQREAEELHRVVLRMKARCQALQVELESRMSELRVVE